MKRRFHTLLLWLAFSPVGAGLFAQQADSLHLLCQQFDYQELEKGLNAMPGQIINSVNHDWKRIREVEIINGYFEHVIAVNENLLYENEKTNSVEFYKILNIIVIRNTIVYCELIDRGYRVIGKPLEPSSMVLKNPNHPLQDLQTSYLQAYHKPLDITELFNTKINFGKYCGLAGSLPTERQKLEKLIKRKNKKK